MVWWPPSSRRRALEHWW